MRTNHVANSERWNEYVFTAVGAEFGEIRPLDEGRMQILSDNGFQLVNRIDPNHAFVTQLATAGCITWPQRQHILDIPQSRDRNEKLLEFLTRRSVADYEKFVNVLANCEQAHLVCLLFADGGTNAVLTIWFTDAMIMSCLAYDSSTTYSLSRE